MAAPAPSPTQAQYAVRGGILDFYPPGARPVRLDFFGDTLDSIRAFDPETQRTLAALDAITLLPMSEAPLTEEARKRFRTRYVELFGPVGATIRSTKSVSVGRQHQGMEHWLPLFHERLESLFDYLPDAIVTFDALDDDARAKRLEQVKDHDEARDRRSSARPSARHPITPCRPRACFSPKPMAGGAARSPEIVLDPFEHPDAARDATVVSFGGRQGRPSPPSVSAKAATCSTLWSPTPGRLQGEGKRVLVACWSKGAKERLATLLADDVPAVPLGQLAET